MSIGVITGEAVEGGGATLLARIVGQDGEPITRRSIESISYAVYNLDDSTSELTGTLSKDAVVFDSLQANAIWTKDDEGYNFKWTVPASTLADGGERIQVDVKFTPVSGEAFVQVFQVQLQDTHL